MFSDQSLSKCALVKYYIQKLQNVVWYQSSVAVLKLANVTYLLESTGKHLSMHSVIKPIQQLVILAVLINYGLLLLLLHYRQPVPIQ